MDKSMGTCRGCGRRFSMPQSGFVDKDEEHVQSKSSKVGDYDKISKTGEISPLVKLAELDHLISRTVQERSDMIVENRRLKKQVEELSKKNGELQETHVKILQENGDLQVQISSLSASQMFLEDQTNSLRSEMDRRALAFDEEKVLLKGIVSELKTSLDSLNKDLESSRAMEYEKMVDLQHQLASLSVAKMLLEEETKSLQSEMDRRTSVLEEEKVNMKGTLRELEIERDSLNEDLESSRAMEEEIQGQIVDLRNQLFDSAKAMTWLEQKNHFLVTGMIKCREENDLLQRRIRDFDFEVNCLKKDLEYKDVRLRQWIEKVDSRLLENGKLKKDLQSKDIRLQELTEKVQSHLLENKKLKKDIESKDVGLRLLVEMLLENGKEKCVHESENEKENGMDEKPKANGKIDMKTAQAKSMREERTARQLLTDRTTPKQVAGRGMTCRM